MTGAIQTPKSDLTVLLSNIKSVDPDTLIWSGADAVIYRPVDQSLDRAQVRFRGTIKTAASDIATRRMSLSLEVSTKMVDRNTLRSAFSGSGGAGGDPELRGTLKPAGFGNVRNVGVVFFDLVRNIGMIDGYGNCQSITWLGEGLSSLGPSVGDYPTYAALAAAIDNKTIVPGRWGTCIAEGMIGLGAPPVRNITCHARFGFGLPGSMMQRILQTHARVPDALIDTAAFAALDAAVPRPVHYWLQEQRSALDLVQALAASCNASPIITFANAISVTRIFDGPDIGTVARGGWADINPTAWRSADVLDTYWQVGGIGVRPGTVSDRADVLYADDFADKGVYNPGTVYRQGNEVWLPNRSQWLYINTTASAGHAPPDPVAADAWWQQLQPAQTAGDIAYEDGTPVEYLKPAVPGADQTAGSPTGIAVDAGLNEDGSVKPDKVDSDALQKSSAQQLQFTLLNSDVSVQRGNTIVVASVTVIKDEVDSLLKISFFGNFSSQDDIQFASAFTVDDSYSFPAGNVNIVLDTQNSQGRMPITPFTYAMGVGAGSHKIDFTVTNNETDNVPLVVRAGSALEVLELKKAST